MQIALESMAIEMPAVSAHPNRQPFRGVLTLVDLPSDRAPAGARGHRVVLTRAAANAAIPSLLGMGLDYTTSYDGHNARSKIGIITEAEIVPIDASPWVAQAFRPAFKAENNKAALAPGRLVVHGFLFARDFPDVVREIRAASQPSVSDGARLGMSYEIADAHVANVRDPIWRLTEVTFTGAAVLRRAKAAYSNTSIELVSEPARRQPATQIAKGEPNMNPEVTQQFLESSSRLAAPVPMASQLGRSSPRALPATARWRNVSRRAIAFCSRLPSTPRRGAIAASPSPSFIHSPSIGPPIRPTPKSWSNFTSPTAWPCLTVTRSSRR